MSADTAGKFWRASEEEWQISEFHVKYADLYPCVLALDKAPDGTILKVEKPGTLAAANAKRGALAMLAQRKFSLRIQTRMNGKYILIRKHGGER
jgi:hypothetical protein